MPTPKLVDVDENSQTTPVVIQQAPEVPINSTDPTFYDITDLPSKSKFYPEGTKISGRPLKVLEIKQLSTINETNADNIINSILRRTIRGINIDDLEVADKHYIIFWERANTYPDSGYSIGYECSKCNQQTSYDFSLDKLSIKYLDDNFSFDKLKFSLKKSGEEVVFDFPRVKDERVADEFKANANYIQNIDSEIVGLCSLIKTINGENKNMPEKYLWITEMNPQDFAYFNSYINKWSFGIKPYIQVTCKNCGGIAPMGITFQGDFWIPEVEIG
jgi:hypothetical protein